MSGELEGKTRPGLEQRLNPPDSESGLHLSEEAAYSQTAADVWNFRSTPRVCPKCLHPHFNCRNKPFWALDFISKLFVFTSRTVLSVKYFNISLKSYKDQDMLFFPNPSSSSKFIAMCLMLQRKKIGPGALHFSASFGVTDLYSVCVTWLLCFSDRWGLVQHGQSAMVPSTPSLQASSPGPASSGPCWGSWQRDGLSLAGVLRPECPYAPPNCCPPAFATFSPVGS